MKSDPRNTIAAIALVLVLVLPFSCNAHEIGNRDAVPTPAASVLRGHTTPVSGGSLLAISGCGTEAATSGSGTSAPPAAIALGLTMADFTGDSHPDLATVELDGLDSSSATYSIEIRLTEGGRQYLTLTAPFGSLHITPKDVTGDGTLDLVVRAGESHVPVAVFLNDGCGHFSEAAEPAAFAQALREVPSESSLTARQLYFGTIVVSVKSHTVDCQSESLRNPQEKNVSRFTASYGAPSHSFFSFGSNRAPPTVA